MAGEKKAEENNVSCSFSTYFCQNKPTFSLEPVLQNEPRLLWL